MTALVTEVSQLPRDGIVYFFAEWSPATKAMDVLVAELEVQHPSIHIVKCEAESAPELSSKLFVEVVPSFVCLREGSILSRVDGANPPELARQAEALASALNVQSAEPQDLNARLAALIASSRVMVFIKGSASAPKCKFSREVMEILTVEGISFGTFDILTDDDVRQGLKSYSKWPTYPQLYVNSELVGGLDIIKELRGTGTLIKDLGLVATEDVPAASLEDRIRSLIGQQRCMVFIKGTPENPRCGFSSKLVAILKDEGFLYGYFDILTDEDVRQGLKSHSKWPTYPQMYVDSELIGGLDIIEELRSAGELSALKA